MRGAMTRAGTTPATSHTLAPRRVVGSSGHAFAAGGGSGHVFATLTTTPAPTSSACAAVRRTMECSWLVKETENGPSRSKLGLRGRQGMYWC